MANSYSTYMIRTQGVLLTLSLILLTLSINIGAQQLEVISAPHSPEPLASNNNLLQQGQPIVSDSAVNCTIATAKPNAEIGKYIFKSCIVAQFSAYLSVGQNKFIELNKGAVNTTSSQCDNTTAKIEPKLVIDYPCASLQFSIAHTNDSKTFVALIAGQYHVQEAGKETIVTFTNSTPTFNTTQSGHYYKCNSEQTIPMGNSINLVLTNFALEAYRDTTGTDFYQIPEECPLDSQPVSDLVRIGVGVCLVALVAIVLIAYFIGRRRWSERSSYESV